MPNALQREAHVSSASRGGRLTALRLGAFSLTLLSCGYTHCRPTTSSDPLVLIALWAGLLCSRYYLSLKRPICCRKSHTAVKDLESGLSTRAISGSMFMRYRFRIVYRVLFLSTFVSSHCIRKCSTVFADILVGWHPIECKKWLRGIVPSLSPCH